MLSIGDWVDKLTIENIKIFTIRDRMNAAKEDHEEYQRLYRVMMEMIDNRAKIANSLDEKVKNVLAGKEDNEFISRIRTYNL